MYSLIESKDLEYNANLNSEELNDLDTGNDFHNIVINKYGEINKIYEHLNKLEKVIFTRLTGSGSCIFSVFDSKKHANEAYLIIKDKFPQLWSCVVENNVIN